MCPLEKFESGREKHPGNLVAATWMFSVLMMLPSSDVEVWAQINQTGRRNLWSLLFGLCHSMALFLKTEVGGPISSMPYLQGDLTNTVCIWVSCFLRFGVRIFECLVSNYTGCVILQSHEGVCTWCFILNLNKAQGTFGCCPSKLSSTESLTGRMLPAEYDHAACIRGRAVTLYVSGISSWFMLYSLYGYI